MRDFVTEIGYIIQKANAAAATAAAATAVEGVKAKLTYSPVFCTKIATSLAIGKRRKG